MGSFLDKAEDYLTFFVKKLSQKCNVHVPAQKSELVRTIAQRIRNWDHPLMVHESLKKLAKLTQTPEGMITQGEEIIPTVIKTSASVSHSEVDPDRVLEADLLRWLFLVGEGKPHFAQIAEANITVDHFRLAPARRLYTQYLETCRENKPMDLLSFAIALQTAEEQLFLSEMLQKRINPEKAEALFIETVQKILIRRWMTRREEIKSQILSGNSSQDELMELAKRFDEIKKEQPKVVIPERSHA